MVEWKLRGYVTPEDFGGDVQAALNKAQELDIRKVVLRGDYSCGTLVIPAFTHLVIQGTLKANLLSKKISNYSFEQDRFMINGGGKVVGDLYFYNTRRAVVEDLTVEGSVTYEYSRDMRMEHCTVSGDVKVGRGCANSIFQHITVGSFRIDNTVFCGDIVPAKEPDIKNILLRDSVMTAGSVNLLAADECGMFNIQADHITAPQTAVVIGKEGQQLPAERYFNLTITDLTAPQQLAKHNEVKHAYIQL
jgi:hypothetical protein